MDPKGERLYCAALPPAVAPLPACLRRPARVAFDGAAYDLRAAAVEVLEKVPSMGLEGLIVDQWIRGFHGFVEDLRVVNPPKKKHNIYIYMLYYSDDWADSYARCKAWVSWTGRLLFLYQQWVFHFHVSEWRFSMVQPHALA